MFRKAEIIELKAKERQSAMAQWLKDEERNRQETELKMLKRALSVRIQNFQDEWAEKRREMEEEVARKLAEAHESCESEKMQLEHRLSRQRLKPVKYSPEVRDRLIQTTKLCAAHEFQQATYELMLLKVTAPCHMNRIITLCTPIPELEETNILSPANAARAGQDKRAQDQERWDQLTQHEQARQPSMARWAEMHFCPRAQAFMSARSAAGAPARVFRPARG